MAFNVHNALLDSSAGGEALYHRLLPLNFIKTSQKPKLYHIGGGVSVAGHNNKQTDTTYLLAIPSFTTESVLIDGRRVPTFLFCDTGKHDILIGQQQWFKKTRSLICRLPCPRARLERQGQQGLQLWRQEGDSASASRNASEAN
jgi:hypothetical protein